MSEETTQPFNGVDAIVDRMKRFPHEFFESGSERGRWSFIYKDYFKDTMTEVEKGRIFEQLKVVRRMELDAMILKELFKEEKKRDSDGEMMAFKTKGRYNV